MLARIKFSEIVYCVAVVAGLLAGVGCGKGGVLNPFGKSDPLRDKEDYIRNAKPGFSKPDLKGPSDDSLIISTNQSLFRFEEGVSSEFFIRGRVLIEGYTSELVMMNLEEFPGALFDAVSGTLAWTPGADFVPAGQLYTDLILRAELRVRSLENKNILIRKTKDIQVIVHSREVRPSLVADTFVPDQSFRQGEKYNFDLSVDLVADAPQTQVPTLRFEINDGTGSDQNISRFVSIDPAPTLDPQMSSRWIYKVHVDLRSLFVKENLTDFQFAIRAVNLMNQASLPRYYKMSVFALRQEPEVTCGNCLWRVKQKVSSSGEFFSFDQQKFGSLVVKADEKTFPKGFTLNCNGKETWLQSCIWRWTPDKAAELKTYLIDLTLSNTSTDQKDPANIVRALQLSITLEK